MPVCYDATRRKELYVFEGAEKSKERGNNSTGKEEKIDTTGTHRRRRTTGTTVPGEERGKKVIIGERTGKRSAR